MSESRWQTRAVSTSSDSNSASVPEDETTLVLIQGTNPFGERIYCYLEVDYKTYQIIKPKMLNNEQFNPRDYGRIVAAGLGQPSDETRAEIKEEYGFEPLTVNEEAQANEKYEYEDIDDFPF